jgi:hypothetical protein
MTFIRVKKRNTKKGDCFYAYLVENKWCNDRRQAKQRVKLYLGKVCRPEKQALDFFAHKGIEDKEQYFNNPFQTILNDLIEWELHQHNATNVNLDFNGMQITNSGKQVVVAMNEGFLCSHTLKSMFELANTSCDEPQPGYRLAKALTEAGIQVPKEVFVALYEKLPKTSEHD